jgi:hypothetical protein
LSGFFLIVHGFAHTLVGMRATDLNSPFGGSASALAIISLLWVCMLIGSIAAAAALFGLLRWGSGSPLLVLTALTSFALLRLASPSFWTVPGTVIDGTILFTVFMRDPSRGGAPARRHARAGRIVLGAIALYSGLAITARPFHMRWGNTREQLAQRLPGDDTTFVADYMMQHSVWIDTEPAAVWPWLVQIGHDKGGFYSYTRIENLLGLRIRNANHIHPEWQTLRAGDSVIATPPDYLSGRRLGWRVGAIEKNRVLVLEDWGSFVLTAESGGTRLTVRTRRAADDGLVSFLMAPFDLLALEPAHFIMERRMLLGIRQRAERRAGLNVAF